ncbi:MAG: hypothetical protein L0Y71_26185 [Gemmataceae bacterium]|nr:hypothetical protein [Gemmataceae bacterium]
MDLSALKFPAGDALAGWGRQLASFQPHALWAGHLFWNRVEALVQTTAPCTLDRFALMILKALALDTPARDTPARDTLARGDDLVRNLTRRLHVPEAMLRQTLLGLVDDGLVAPELAGLTDVGRAAAADGAYPRRHWRRRQFTFVERLDAGGRRAAAPQPLPLGILIGAGWTNPAPWDDAFLRDAVQRDAAWKQVCGFPGDVLALADAAPAFVPAWQRVTVVRPEKAVVLLARCGPDGRLLGFAVLSKPGAAPSPFAQLPAEAAALAPELTPEPADEDVRAAWLHWCRDHGVRTPLVESCPCHVEGLSLSAQVPAVVLHEMRTLRCGVDGEEWLLLGNGPMRRAVQVNVAAS